MRTPGEAPVIPALEPDGLAVLMHAPRDGDYKLEERFQLGRILVSI